MKWIRTQATSDCNFTSTKSAIASICATPMKPTLLILLIFIMPHLASAVSLCHKPPQKVKTETTEKKPAADQGPNLDGVVEVSFKIDDLGKVQILNINSTSPQLSDYVIKKLGKIQLDEGTTKLGKVIKYRFVFKKQA